MLPGNPGLSTHICYDNGVFQGAAFQDRETMVAKTAGPNAKNGDKAGLKTRPNSNDVAAFIDAVEDEQKREDSKILLELMKRATGCEPVMWGTSIIGFGSYEYTYASGHSAEWCATGFSPRKAALTVYIMSGFPGYDALMERLGRYKTGKSCLYIKRLADIDVRVLEELVAADYRNIKQKYPDGAN
ncbi:MAG: DUF1801 domain-containing protein [Pseudomonadota bacterium]